MLRSLASMRQGTIRRRNRMAKRSELMPSGSVYSGDSLKSKPKPRASRWSSMFPIKRKTSFRYTPISKSHRKPFFESQNDADRFFLLDGIASVVRGMLPRTMLTYKYKKVTKIYPELHLCPERFAITENNSFQIVGKNDVAVPLEATRAAPPPISKEMTRTIQTRKGSAAFTRRQVFLSTVYKEYREKVLAGKYYIPPKFDLLLPFESGIMKPEEISSMDVKILLEVLLRRTAAAKIEFRLSQSGLLGASSGSASQSSDDGLSSKFSGVGRSFRDNSSTKRSFSASTSSLGSNGRESVASQNPLPSPQISSVSKFDESLTFHDPRSGDIIAQRERYGGLMTSVINDSTAFKSTKKDLLRHIAKDYPPSALSDFTSSSLYSGTSSRQRRNTKTHLNNIVFTPLPSEVGSLSNINMYSLQPMNRSVTTISSALGFNSDSGQNSNESKILELRFAPKKARGDSNSTTNTSVIHSLEDIDKRMSQHLTEDLSSPEGMYLSQTPSSVLLETSPISHAS